MASKQSFSLWLKPPAGSALYKKLAQEVATQAKACPSAAPLFEPHVTLLGGIQGERDSVLATAKGLAAKLKVCCCGGSGQRCRIGLWEQRHSIVCR